MNYLSKITGKPILPIGSSLLIDADFDDIRSSIIVSREECTNEIAYIITERRYHIDPLLYLKCYRDLMNIDKKIGLKKTVYLLIYIHKIPIALEI